MKRSNTHPLSVVTLCLVVAGCDASDNATKRRNLASDDGGSNAPACTDFGKGYTGFGGTKLEDKRVNAAIGADRARIKPYTALKAEYERVIGQAPDSLGQAAGSFGSPPARFASEPRAGAIQLYSAFRVAFDGCLTFTATAAEFGAAPTKESATAQCTTMARKFWSRAPTPEEVDQCTQVALNDSSKEADVRRRWAYTCATLLSSAGFLTY